MREQKVLVVDDSLDFAQALAAQLVYHRRAAVAVGSVRDALDLLDEDPTITVSAERRPHAARRRVGFSPGAEAPLSEVARRADDGDARRRRRIGARRRSPSCRSRSPSSRCSPSCRISSNDRAARIARCAMRMKPMDVSHSPWRYPPSAVPARGSQRRNSLPLPNPSLLASTRPPWISATPFTSASPMPRPPSERSSCDVICANIWNRRGKAAGAMPIPLSRSAMQISRPSTRADNSSRPPGSVYLAALLSRLPTACVIRKGST